MYIVYCYLTYLALSVGVTVWVARTLQHNGRTFLVDAFHGNQELADSVNRLLVVGFYLINIGCVTLSLRPDWQIPTATATVQLACDKFGWGLVVLGLASSLNIYLVTRVRRAAQPTCPPSVSAPASSVP